MESDSSRLRGQTGFFLSFSPVLFEVSIGQRLCQVQGLAREKAPAEESPERPARACGARGPRRPGLARGPGSGRRLGWWPGALTTPGSPRLGQERALPLFPDVRVSSLLTSSSGRDRHTRKPTARRLRLQMRTLGRGPGPVSPYWGGVRGRLALG